jgi:hypothetical protein
MCKYRGCFILVPRGVWCRVYGVWCTATLSVCWGVGIDFALAVLIIPLLSSAEAKELWPTDVGNRPSSYLSMLGLVSW